MKKYLQKFDTLGLVLLVVAALWYSVSNIWEKWNIGLVIAGGVFLIIGVAANYRQIIGTLGKRSTKYASNYVISLVLVIALVSGLNYIGQRHTKRIDTTSNRYFSLSPQTIQILNKLNKDLDIKAFYPGGESADLKELLTEYKTASQRVKYKFVDPDKQSELAKQSGVNSYGTVQNPLTGQTFKFGTVVISYGDKKEKIEKQTDPVQEQDITNAIIKLGRNESKKVYFVQGHSEKNIEDTNRVGYSELKKGLESQGYKVEAVNLINAKGVPADAKVLIEAGPQTNPFDQELQYINDFLNNGGSVFVMCDPRIAPDLEAFLKPWGVIVHDDIVLDERGVGLYIPLVRSYEQHRITDQFDKMTFFPLTRSLEKSPGASPDLTVEVLFKSNPDSWGETNFSQPSFDAGKDHKGPLPLAIAVSKEIRSQSDAGSGRKARLIATGTSNFPINSYFHIQGNGDMFLNMVSWLAQDEDLISIRPREEQDRKILLSVQNLALIRMFVLFVLPGIALIAGVMVVLNRRSK